MMHITGFLVVLTLVVGCGRDKKAWAHKINALVTRAYACKDIACAKAVDVEMGAIVGGDEGRNLGEGEPEFMFSSAERIRNRVAELEADAKLAKMRASSPLTALEVFHTTLGACSLAYNDLRLPVRAAVEASIAKVGAVLPPDQVAKANAPGGLFWHDAFVDAFVTAMDGKVPLEDMIYTRVAAALCLVNYRYEAETAKRPEMWSTTMEKLERIMAAVEQDALVKDLVVAVRRAAPDKEVFELTKSTTKAIYASLENAPKQ